jgi:hypothetical protein
VAAGFSTVAAGFSTVKAGFSTFAAGSTAAGVSANDESGKAKNRRQQNAMIDIFFMATG